MKIKEAFKSVKLCRLFLLNAALLMIPSFAAAEALYSPSWGFSVDVPEGYEFSGGDGRKSFSFSSSNGAMFDFVVYDGGRYQSLEECAEAVKQQLGSQGEIGYFDYHGKAAALLEIIINNPQNPLTGWCFVGELPDHDAYLTALAYAPYDIENIQSFHFSAIDSINLSEADRLTPGPISECMYPRGAPKETLLAGGRCKAMIHEGDAEASQAVVDREFTVLAAYVDSPLWREAWRRFYRAIYRDSYMRLADAAFIVERFFFLESRKQIDQSETDAIHENRIFAEKVLEWVQSFTYERDLMGSDFVNLVSAAVEGRGDCDSRAMLWALILQRNNIPAAIMVSKDYGHAMGLADIEGDGARFDLGGKEWLVAETVMPAPLGRVEQSFSDPRYWLGIAFE